MINQIKLKCFRRHEDRTITFADGVNIMRAANEAGKSTVVEAILYAWFGADALRNTFADTVTWGRKESELKVELTHTVEGRLFRFTRGKSGAECHYDGGIVTGQKEVSAFAAEILGGDRKTVVRLMMANQASLRGALEEGPTAVSAMIEGLADFDLFERLNEAAASKLATGSTVACEDRIRRAEEAVAAANVVAPDFAETDAQIANETAFIADRQAAIDAMEPEKVKAQVELETVQQAQQRHESAQSSLVGAEQSLLDLRKQKAEAEDQALRVPEGNLEELQAELDKALTFQDRLKAFRKFTALPSIAAEWEGNRESFDKEIDEVIAAVAVAEELVQGTASLQNDVRSKSRQLRSQLISDTCCPTCKRALDNAEEIAEHNDDIAVQLKQYEDQLTDLSEVAHAQSVGLASLKKELEDLRKVEKSSRTYEMYAAEYGVHVNVDFGFVPPRLTWKGETPVEGESEDAQEIRNWIVSWKSAKDNAERANARSQSLAETIERAEGTVEECRRNLALHPEPRGLETLTRVREQLGTRILVARDDILRAQQTIQSLRLQRQKLLSEYEAQQNRLEDLRGAVTQAREELDQIAFNNALMTKVRKARPIIADKLWNTVLASVSTMFTSMRGEVSVVTKDSGGFKVNGAAVTSLSGSALDLLGLAIRVALVKTFLPHIDLLVLDEPFAACSQERTEAMLGFITTSSFGQTVIISHEDLTESSADHFISI